MQLFVPLLGALILDAALGDKVPECAANKQNPTLCHLLLWTYQLNEALEDIWRGNHTLEGVRDGASKANNALTKALRTTDKEGVLSALKEALHVEGAMLPHLKSLCEEPKSCKGAFLSFMHSVYTLVRAFAHVVEGTQKATVEQALHTFRIGVVSDSGNLGDEASKMVTQVLAVI